MKHNTKFFTIGIVLIFIVFSLIASSQKALWRDEAFTVLISRQSLAEIVKSASADVSPPLFYLIMWIWQKIVGTQAIFLRFVPLFFSVLSILLMLRSRETITRIIAKAVPGIERSNSLKLIYAVLVATSPVLLYFSFELRTYSLLIFLVFLSSIFAYRLFYFLHWQEAILFTIVNTALLYTHNLGLIWLIGQYSVITLACLITKKWKELLVFFTSGIIVLIFYIPWLNILIFQTKSVDRGFWLTFDPKNSLKEYRGVFAIDEGLIRNKDLYLRFAVFLGLLSGIGLFTLLRKLSRFLLPVSMALVTAVGFYIFSVLVSPILYVRYVSLLAPFALLLIFLSLIVLKKINPFVFWGAFLVYILFVGNIIINDMWRGISLSDYRKLSDINANIVYTDEVMDIMPCIVYSRSCYYVGNIKKTPWFVGPAQLASIPSIATWQEVTDSHIFILYRDELSEEAAKFVRENNFSNDKIQLNLGDGVVLQEYGKNQ